MAYKLNEKQNTIASEKSPEARYEYVLNKVANFEEIWSLHSSDGWVELSDGDGNSCLPIWPHPDFAKAWANEDWSDCEPKVIALDVWLERWTQGLANDETLLVVFPVGEDGGMVQSPEDFHEDLLAAIGA